MLNVVQSTVKVLLMPLWNVPNKYSLTSISTKRNKNLSMIMIVISAKLCEQITFQAQFLGPDSTLGKVNSKFRIYFE